MQAAAKATTTPEASAVTPFQFEAHEIRAVTDEHGEPWFRAKDVCDILGYKNDSKAVGDHCRAKGVTKRYSPTDGGDQEVTYINEGNLYRLIIKSRKPEAEKFEIMVMEEILPAIRRTGKYSVPVEPTITPAQQSQLQQAIKKRFPEGKLFPYAWSRFNAHFEIGSYKQLPGRRTEEALEYIAQMPGPGSKLEIEGHAQKERAMLDRLLMDTRFILYVDFNGKIKLEEMDPDGFVTSMKNLANCIDDAPLNAATARSLVSASVSITGWLYRYYRDKDEALQNMGGK